MKISEKFKKDWLPVLGIIFLMAVVLIMPTKYDQIIYENTTQAAARVMAVDESNITTSGLIKFGEQICEIKILDGKFKGQVTTGINHLSGSMRTDKMFNVGDKIFVVIDYTEGNIRFVNLIDHYRLDLEVILAAAFMIIIIAFAGPVGARSLLAFACSIVLIWKILVPAFLSGYNPIAVGIFITILLTVVIIGLIYGFDKRSLAAISGSVTGILLTCLMALIFTRLFKIHGAVMESSESLLYSGYAHLDLTEIFIASIFIASSGAIMDVAVDITAAIGELVEKRPDLSKFETIKSGMSIGRSVIGTMTTTLLLAYSGGYIALLMVFMAQGTPILNILNLKYVSTEILQTLIGSFGLVAVAPLTAITSGLLLGASHSHGSLKNEEFKESVAESRSTV
ncbi:YibE/F family protein [Anaeropeptidivorans aminofermentans]|uniref:YibE/F family protein n=1 Tax=Anaeropeptidivorans aminofermentans TaxID=2934315 RepID=UPI002025248E|nr:YibE/F family protein [Anaeropeptidivorans aminofermentans]MBE6011854.1 YibE/F family protein [Lachnospiraceae bacterium]